MSVASTAFDTSQLLRELARILPAGGLITDEAERRYYGQDAFWTGLPPLAVAVPADQEQTCAVIRACAAAGVGIVPRGGGMSYTKGYVPSVPGVVTLDLRGLNRIVDIDAENMIVTAEAGVTWMQLYEALREKGLRTPYFGPMSGMRATVGGALSQNSMFYGSATYGTVAESVLSLKVALADGRTVVTGSRANRGGIAFHRHFGPDLTGLFLSDAGALAVKLEASIRLLEWPQYETFGSFAFDDFGSMLAAQAQIARRRIAAECFGLDPYLNGSRTMVKDLKTGVKTLADLATGGRTLREGLANAASVALAGTGFMEGVRYSLHVVCEGETEAIARWRIEEARRIALQTGREIDATIPKVCRATPFKHPGEFLVGHEGERWVPIHACLPLSKGQAAYEATMKFFASKREILERYHIATSHLTGSAGTDLIFEPAFYYPDAMTEFHLRNLEPKDARKYADRPVVPGASEAVAGMLVELSRVFLELGAVHQQLGRFYPYADSLDATTLELVRGIKSLVDPAGRMNPGALGL
jgi:D-lactate dehydrogenase (cytochrome)